MVRDDFGSATKFLTDDLGTTIDRDRNFTWVDLFEPGHARHVLIRFGQAYGKLPIQADQFTDSDHQFLDAAVQGLMQEGKEQGVVPVQLALFADMVKSKAWEPATLDSSGGARGVVLNFLEEAFSARNPQNRIHQNGARGVLKALMPALGGDIKGQQRSTQELLEVSGYADKSREFDRLIKILDSDLRLIRPSEDQEDPQGVEVGYYQLTHDYLVPSLREWLTRKQRETKKGRAELRLADRAAAWNANSENKQLPTLWEWLQIRRWTEKSKWTRAERSLMQRAGGVHLRNWGTACSILLLAGSTIGYVFQQQSLKGQQEKITVAIDSQMYPSEVTALSGNKLPNPWGFHDMHGNVSEYCSSRYYDIGPQRVLRDGCFYDKAEFCQSARFIPSNTHDRGLPKGFRLALGSLASPKLPEADQ
jgi:hypothetical protein